jgi:hypothetical protein
MIGFAGCGSTEPKWMKLFCFFFLEKEALAFFFARGSVVFRHPIGITEMVV